MTLNELQSKIEYQAERITHLENLRTEHLRTIGIQAELIAELDNKLCNAYADEIDLRVQLLQQQAELQLPENHRIALESIARLKELEGEE